MKHRRNPDDKLRRLEREYAGNPNASTLLAYNIERLRCGEPLIVAPSSFIRSQKHLWEPEYWNLSVLNTQFEAIEIRKNILDKSLPMFPADRDQWLAADQKMRECISTILSLGWICLVQQCGNFELRIKHLKQYDEYVVQWKQDGKIDDNKSYYTSDKDDAQQTMKHMLATQGPSQYPTLFAFPATILRPSGQPSSPKLEVPGTVIADQWMKDEDPRSLTDPQFRRGSYPCKTVLYERKFEPASDRYDKRFVTVRCGYSYDTGEIALNYSHYDLTWEAATMDYLVRLLKLNDDCSYQIFDKL